MKYAPYVHVCKYCGTKSNAMVCPSRQCLARDEKEIASRKWRAPLKPAQAQLPADVGLFSDDHLQLDLVEMLQEPANE